MYYATHERGCFPTEFFSFRFCFVMLRIDLTVSNIYFRPRAAATMRPEHVTFWLEAEQNISNFVKRFYSIQFQPLAFGVELPPKKARERK